MAMADPATDAANSPPTPVTKAPTVATAAPQKTRSVPAAAKAPAITPQTAGVPVPVAVVRDGEGLITISSVPRADVYVDGQLIRKTPLFKHEVQAGARAVRLVAADGRTHEFKLDVRDGADINKVWSFDDGRFERR